VVEYVPSNCSIKRFRAALSVLVLLHIVLVGPCCPALLNCIDVDVHTVVLPEQQSTTLSETMPLVLSCDAGLLTSSSLMSVLPSISEPSLSLVLPSDPVDVVDEVESLPDTFGFASADELQHHSKQLTIYHMVHARCGLVSIAYLTARIQLP